VIGNSVTLRERARVSRSIVDSSTYLGRSTVVEGAIIGRACDIRAHARVHEGVAIGDEVTIGNESEIMPGVRIYPFKEVDTGSHIYESLIWESRGTARVFGKNGVSGLVNVDLTPDIAVRLAAAFGTALKRGARVVASREGTSACRMIKRAMISGLSSTGVAVADLRIIPAGVARHLVKSEGFEAGFHVGISPSDPEAIRIQFFEQPGIEMSLDLQKEVEKHFTRGELRRVASSEVGAIRYPARVRESYASDLLETIDVDAVRARSFRIVVDYGFSASSYVLPLVLGPLGVEAVAAHAFPTDGDGVGAAGGLGDSIGQAKRLVSAVGADLGAVFDRAGERVYLIDEQAHEIPVEQALLLYLRLIGSSGRQGRLAFPVTVTRQVDRLVEGSGLEIVRTPASLQDLTKAAAQDGVIFAGALGGGYVFPDFLLGYDAVTSLAKLLELLAPVDRPISELVAELPAPTIVHRQLPCPWALKGLVMRILNERLTGREVDLTDGIKVFSDAGWAQVLPDPDEPLLHLYAEGDSTEASEELARELLGMVEEIEQGDAAAART
jgi:mannose-1-phosphate guanylyltransferase/phosphomannomutase